MSDAEELKSGITQAIDLQERAMSHLEGLREATDQLKGQLLILGISTSSSPVSGAINRVENAEINTTAIAFDLQDIRERLDVWYGRL